MILLKDQTFQIENIGVLNSTFYGRKFKAFLGILYLYLYQFLYILYLEGSLQVNFPIYVQTNHTDFIQ